MQECVNDTFIKADGAKEVNYDMDENFVLENNAGEWKVYGHQIYPSIVINERTFRGRLTSDNVFEAICASFIREPRECRAWQMMEGIPLPIGQSRGISTKTFIFLILALVIANSLIVCIYKKYLERELNKDMKMQVSSAVS